MEQAICAECGAAFPLATPGRTWQRYCSTRCGMRYKRKHRKPLRSCLQCGQDFRADKPSSRYCSTKCMGWARTAMTQRREPLERQASCVTCGTQFIPTGAQRYCSPPCRPNGYEPRTHPRPCIQCGAVFTPADGRLRVCSIECRRKGSREAGHRSKGVRRAQRKKAPTIERVYRARIFKRDHYRCQLCGKLLKMDAVVPHPKAPTIDHIVPLSCGGAHAPANVQAAHFICNSRKHTRPQGEQLLMI